MSDTTNPYREDMLTALELGALEYAAAFAVADSLQDTRTFYDLVDEWYSDHAAPDAVYTSVLDRADSFIRTRREIEALPEHDCDGHCSGHVRRSEASQSPIDPETLRRYVQCDVCHERRS